MPNVKIGCQMRTLCLYTRLGLRFDSITDGYQAVSQAAEGLDPKFRGVLALFAPKATRRLLRYSIEPVRIVFFQCASASSNTPQVKAPGQRHGAAYTRLGAGSDCVICCRYRTLTETGQCNGVPVRQRGI